MADEQTGFKKTGRGQQLGLIIPDPKPEDKTADDQQVDSNPSSDNKNEDK